jgi:hypothetical protein
MIFIWRTISGAFFIGVYLPILFINLIMQGIILELARFTYHYYMEELKNKHQRNEETYNKLILTYPITFRVSKEKWFAWFDFLDLFGRPFNPLIFAVRHTINTIKNIDI